MYRINVIITDSFSLIQFNFFQQNISLQLKYEYFKLLQIDKKPLDYLSLLLFIRYLSIIYICETIESASVD
jgi:hypothetical protein